MICGVYPDNEKLLGSQKKRTTDLCYNMDKPQETALWKKPHNKTKYSKIPFKISREGKTAHSEGRSAGDGSRTDWKETQGNSGVS